VAAPKSRQCTKQKPSSFGGKRSNVDSLAAGCLCFLTTLRFSGITVKMVNTLNGFGLAEIITPAELL